MPVKERDDMHESVYLSLSQRERETEREMEMKVNKKQKDNIIIINRE